MQFVRKHFGALLLAAGLNWSSFWSGVKWLWDWAGRFDLVYTHAGEIGAVGGMIGYLTNPPPWAIFPTALVGVLIVLWDIRHPGAIGGFFKKNVMAILVGAIALCLLGAGAKLHSL
jgi:hypothetical protein